MPKRRTIRNLIRYCLQLLAAVPYRVRIVGDAAAFVAPRLLTVANRESFLDGLLRGLFLPVRPLFVVHSGAIRFWCFGMLLSQVDCLAALLLPLIPVHIATFSAMEFMIKRSGSAITA